MVLTAIPETEHPGVSSSIAGEVPQLSKWRRSVAGDLTSAFNFAAPPRDGRVKLPALSAKAAPACVNSAPVTVTRESLPRQEPGSRKRPSGSVRR